MKRLRHMKKLSSCVSSFNGAKHVSVVALKRDFPGFDVLMIGLALLTWIFFGTTLH